VQKIRESQDGYIGEWQSVSLGIHYYTGRSNRVVGFKNYLLGCRCKVKKDVSAYGDFVQGALYG
jgi:hypothetical protein